MYGMVRWLHSFRFARLCHERVCGAQGGLWPVVVLD